MMAANFYPIRWDELFCAVSVSEARPSGRATYVSHRLCSGEAYRMVPSRTVGLLTQMNTDQEQFIGVNLCLSVA